VSNIPNSNAERLAAWKQAHKGETPMHIIERLVTERETLQYQRYEDITYEDRMRIRHINAALEELWAIQRLWDTATYHEPHHAWTQQ
jgi:hypothetical protein